LGDPLRDERNQAPEGAKARMGARRTKAADHSRDQRTPLGDTGYCGTREGPRRSGVPPAAFRPYTCRGAQPGLAAIACGNDYGISRSKGLGTQGRILRDSIWSSTSSPITEAKMRRQICRLVAPLEQAPILDGELPEAPPLRKSVNRLVCMGLGRKPAECNRFQADRIARRSQEADISVETTRPPAADDSPADPCLSAIGSR